MTDPELATIAAQDAARVRARMPSMAVRAPVRAAGVARNLGVRLSGRRSLGHRAILNYGIGGSQASEIVVDETVGPDVRRWCIAHELGHIMLLTRRDGISLSVRQAERFADMFAAELLLPPESRQQARDALMALGNAYDLLSLSQSLGLSPSACLRAAYHTCPSLVVPSRMWLRAEYRTNKYTGLQRRLRIVSALFCRESMFIPVNQGVASLLGDDSWMGGLEPGQANECECKVQLSVRRKEGSGPKFASELIPARASAVRVDSAVGSAYFVLLQLNREFGTNPSSAGSEIEQFPVSQRHPRQLELCFA